MTQTYPQRKDGLIEVDLGDETMLYDADGRRVHVLNRTGQVIWRLCDGEHSMDDMVRTMHIEFDVEQSIDVKADILDTLATLRREGLIR